MGSEACGCKDEDNDGYSTCDGDCLDENSERGFNANPGAEEICGNGINDNCDREGKVDEKPCCDSTDADGDDVNACGGDCDDRYAEYQFDCPPCTEQFGGVAALMAEIARCMSQQDARWQEDICRCSDRDPSPILIDVAGDGFSLTGADGGVRFDLDGDGSVTSGRELFGNFTEQPPPPPGAERNGFLALAEFDRPAHGGNGDGLINPPDAVFAHLRLWRDANHNGLSEPDEMRAPGQLGLKSIGLDYTESKRRDGHGNRFRYRAKVEDRRGARLGRWAWDVFLVSAQ